MAKTAITIVRGVDSHIAGALRVLGLLPRYFVPTVQQEVAGLLESRPWLAAVDPAGDVVGFLMWDERPHETELLWMAVHPQAKGNHVGSALLSNCLAGLDPSKPVYLLTATTDSKIPGTAFDGTAYEATERFFSQRGFVPAEVRKSYWGPMNHCLVMRREPS